MILLYQDEGVGTLSFYALAKSLSIYFPTQKLRYIDSNYLLQEDLSNAKILVLPGGADIPYCKKLNGLGNSKIQNFVNNGGIYLGICAGAYYACSAIEFTGKQEQIFENRELALFSGRGIGSIPEFTNGVYYDATVQTKAIIPISFENQNIYCYYHGGGYFENVSDEQIIATYPHKKPAIICGKYGQGKFFLSGVHFEINAEIYSQFYQSNNILMDNREYVILENLHKTSGEMIWHYFVNNLIK